MIKKTKHGDYERKVRFDVWINYDVRVVFTDDICASRKARYNSYGASEGAAAMHTSATGGVAHLFFKIDNCPVGIIAHECWHAIYTLMTEWAGVEKLDNETVAYHLGWLVQKVADFKHDLIEFGVKSSIKEKATNGNKDSQRELAGLQSVPAQCGGTSTKAGEAGAPFVQAQACDGGNGGPSSTPTGSL